MLVLKIVMLFAVFGTISTIGVKISNRYTERANNLKQIKKAIGCDNERFFNATLRNRLIVD